MSIFDDSENSEGAPETALGKNVAATVHDTLARHQGEPSAGNNGPGLSAPGLGAPGPDANSQLVADTAKAILKAIDTTVCRRIYGAAWSLTKDEEASRAFSSEAALEPGELELVGNLSVVLAQKYGIASQYAAELGLACVLGSYYFRVNSTIKKLEALRQESLGEQTETPPAK